MERRQQEAVREAVQGVQILRKKYHQVVLIHV
jgi:hypothetical protein